METAANIAKIAIEHRATEQALLGEQACMQILMDNLPHAIFFKDRESRFTRVNRAQAGYLSLASPGDAIGRTDYEFFAPEVARRYADDEKAVMATGEPLVNRLEHDGREGDDRRWFLTTKVPIRDADGAIMGTAGIAREVTEKHRLEEALRASHDELEARVRERTLELSQLNENLKVEIKERQRAEERSRGHDAELAHVARLSTLGVMAAALSHELNQPLQAIANYADTCRRWLSRPDPDLDRLRDDLTTIGRLSDRTGEIMGKLRGVFDRTPARETADRMNEVILEIVPALEFAGRRRAVEIRLELADHLPPCPVYRLQMQLVLLTLGHNAIDAMEGLPADERVLTISTDRAGDGGVEIRVRDRGPGLSPDLADRAFEPFFSTKSAGMGLGLALASRLVEAQGGTLDLGSGDGPGACFVVRLPDTGARDPV